MNTETDRKDWPHLSVNIVKCAPYIYIKSSWVESTQSRSFRGRCFYRSDDQTDSVKALNVIQIALNLTKLSSPCYN